MAISNNTIEKLFYKAKDSIMEKQVSSCLIQNGKIISNIFCNTYNYRDSYNSHAETNVILNYYRRHQKNNKKISIITIRLNKHNELCNARPCFHCLDLIKKVGIRKSYYSTDNGMIASENVKYMLSTHLSAGYVSNLNMNREYILEKNLYKHFPIIIKKNNLNLFFLHTKIINKNIFFKKIDDDLYFIYI